MSAVRELFVQLGFKVDLNKFQQFNNSINIAKQNFSNFANEVGKTVAPDLQSLSKERFKELVAYDTELQDISAKERAEVKRLNVLEKQAGREALVIQRQKYSFIKTEQAALLKQEKLRQQEQRRYITSQNSIAAGIKRLALGFGATFSIFSGFKSTLEDIKKFKSGDKSAGVFSKKDIQAATTFSAVIKQVKGSFTEIKNSILIGVMPAISGFLNVINEFVQKNKQLIKQKLNLVIDILTISFKLLYITISKLKQILDPVVEKIGGWSNAISALIALGVVSWIGSVIVAISGFIGITTAASAIVSVFKAGAIALEGALIALRTVMFALSVTPLGLIITAIVAAIAALIINLDLVIPLWDKMRSSISIVTDTMKELWEWLIKAKDAILDFPKNIKTKIEGVFSSNEIPTKFAENAGNVKQILGGVEDAGSKAVVNNSTSSSSQKVTFSPKNSFSFNLNVPSGTTEEQARFLSSLVVKEVDKRLSYDNELFLNTVGAHR